jgi:hypothetical protein
MPLKQRVFKCESCGFGPIDRDLNAALNLVKWYFEVYLRSITTPSSGESYACGDSSAGVVEVNSVTRYESLKQEESNNTGQSSVLFSAA